MSASLSSPSATPILVIGGSGKVGRRVAAGLRDRGHAVRAVSRHSTPRFDWHDARTWAPVLDGVEAVYLSFAPDLAVPGAEDAIRAFSAAAVAAGVRRIVLLSGRGEAEAERCEQVVQASGARWTVVRAAWFAQNFDEGEFRDMVLEGTLVLPAGDIPEPFVDAADIADVAVAALTEPGHDGQVYEVTGPRLLTFTDIAAELSAATGRTIHFQPVPRDAFSQGLAEAGMPGDMIWLLDYLFGTVLDGRNACLGDGVQRALGRAPRDFSAFARQAAPSWQRAA
ncbi:MAG: NAD(P)H-binding protein [Rhodocyclaceae bacterium]|nr:NAD(P)H-binding protein [Rhodocyclaceae bacterium]